MELAALEEKDQQCEEKRCCKCGEVKSLTRFISIKHKRTEKFVNWCDTCRKQQRAYNFVFRMRKKVLRDSHLQEIYTAERYLWMQLRYG